jgi:cell division topological specificity factor
VFNALKRFLSASTSERDDTRAGSKFAAKSRLHFVLVQDRAGLSSEDLTKFKREMIEVIEKYFVIDEQAFDISYKRENDSTTMQINSPILIRRAETPQVSKKVIAPVEGEQIAQQQ